MNETKHWFQGQLRRWETQIQSDSKWKLDLMFGFCFPLHFSLVCVYTDVEKQERVQHLRCQVSYTVSG